MEQTDPRHLLVKIAKLLKKLRIPYLVTGGIAVLVWGRPRFTADIDIVVELEENNLKKLKEGLMKLGRSGYVDEELMRQALADRGEFNFIDGQTGVKVDFWLLKEKDFFDLSRFKRRVAKNILGEKIYFTSPEDLILIKAIWYRMSPMSRQLEDIESILKISGKRLDMKYLRKWTGKLGLSKILSGRTLSQQT
ncbi:MAG: nucleotidyltransferase [Candidatus Portnoybacteria bacterium]|nr:nucleotidyltransferase [Candidatus Portnoybacteria bacterium]